MNYKIRDYFYKNKIFTFFLTEYVFLTGLTRFPR